MARKLAFVDSPSNCQLDSQNIHGLTLNGSLRPSDVNYLLKSTGAVSLSHL